MIYFDNAATTKIKPEVLDKMMPYLTDEFANASSVYSFALKSRSAVDEARKNIASMINAEEKEIYFTSGGSESDNWAIKKIMLNSKKGKHIITSKIEHHAVLNTCEYLEKLGYEVTYLDVNNEGLISLDDLENAIRDDTVMVSIMFANNEIGVIEPIKEIGEICKKHRVLFHTDAVQALPHIKVDVKELGIDLMSATAHKMGGPKGIGFLYVSKSVRIEPMIHGGSQERGKRAGTTNTPGIIGLSEALKLTYERLEKNEKYMEGLRNHLIDRVLNEIPYVRLNGSREKRLSSNANFSFEFIEGESMLLMLSAKGYCASSGSACTSGSLDPSHVLLAIGLPHEIAHGSLRISLSEENTMEEIDKLVDDLKVIIGRLREMSPLYEDFIKKGSN